MAKKKQYLYRVAWFGDDSGETTETLGFVYAENDEKAYDQWEFTTPADEFHEERNRHAFYTVERMEEEERLRDVMDDCPALASLPDAVKWNLASAFDLIIN